MPTIVAANPSTIRAAANILRAGGAVAFATETVYGLGALTFNQRGLELVYELKGRPANNPLIAHVLDAAQARRVIAPGAWDARCEALARKFWPGPLTLVLPRAAGVPDRATAGLPTIAVRAPRHPVARALIEEVREPISAPSANRSGRVSPTSAADVLQEFAEAPEARDLLILDGGECEVGIESTVLDVSGAPARILRPGGVTLEQLREALGERGVEAPEIRDQRASPGTSPAHYAPRTPAELVSSRDLREALRRHGAAGRRCVVLCFDAEAAAPPHAALLMPAGASQYAHDLYRRLREADAMQLDAIVIESPPQTSYLWRAVHDRLRRATVRV